MRLMRLFMTSGSSCISRHIEVSSSADTSPVSSRAEVSDDDDDDAASLMAAADGIDNGGAVPGTKVTLSVLVDVVLSWVDRGVIRAAESGRDVDRDVAADDDVVEAADDV